MHFDITMVFAAIVTTVLCSLPSSLSNLITTQTGSIIATTTNTVEQEQFTYEIVIPRSLRSTRSFSFVPDWKARLRDKDQTYFNSPIRPKRSSKIFLEQSNTTLYYRIYAFNRTFDLSLIEDEIFLAPSFIIQHFDYNRTWLTKDIEHCFYKGYVNRNLLSTVSISLCHGLLGTFIYNDTEYFIEPKYHENDTKWNFEHLFYTHKNSVSSITDDAQTVRCPVDGEPYFEKTKLYPHYHRSPKKKLRRYESSSELKSNDIQNPFKRRAKRQIDYDPMAKHVEVLVAYDESIKEFHSDADIKSYILTLFSYVSHLYSDASIGNNIKIWLVKLVDLGKNHTEYFKSTDDAADILGRFCKWQSDSYKDEKHDAAVLLTRTPLCNKRAKNVTDSKCDTLGLTELGTLCNSTSNCALVRDNGFATAFTIAHEIAHLFGIRHDNDKACLDHTKEQNIMATSLTFNHNHYKWSNCSRHYFTQYLESNRYECLNRISDYRSASFIDLNNEQRARELPGRFSDLNDQCRRAFGVNFEYCKDLSHGVKYFKLFILNSFFLINFYLAEM
jgi:thrombospondin motif-containing protein 9